MYTYICINSPELPSGWEADCAHASEHSANRSPAETSIKRREESCLCTDQVYSENGPLWTTKPNSSCTTAFLGGEQRLLAVPSTNCLHALPVGGPHCSLWVSVRVHLSSQLITPLTCTASAHWQDNQTKWLVLGGGLVIFFKEST